MQILRNGEHTTSVPIFFLRNFQFPQCPLDLFFLNLLNHHIQFSQGLRRVALRASRSRVVYGLNRKWIVCNG
jgi:hypothetical protein